MRNPSAFSCLLALAFLGLMSCDVVPYKDAREVRVVGPDTTPVEFERKVVLLEDYTGHTCGNCPGAAREAKRIEGLFPGRVIVMGVHAGFFARPKNLPNGAYKEDFRTPAGDALDARYGVSAAGLPKGLVNRGRFGNSTINILGSTEWEPRISQILAEEPIGIKITMDPVFNSSNRGLTVTTKVLFQKPFADNLKMALYVTEDSIISWQKEYEPAFKIGGSEDISNYTHYHVLRSDLVPASGSEVVNREAVAANQELESTWSVTLAQKWKAEKCHIIAVLYREDTEEVVQAAETSLGEN
jgi:hypothetical protein